MCDECTEEEKKKKKERPELDKSSNDALTMLFVFEIK